MLAVACVLPRLGAAQVAPPPIIDMHLHAGPADAQGPPPRRICAPLLAFPARDPRWTARQYGAVLQQHKDCARPLMSAATDEELMRQSLEILERRNIYAVTSGPWDHVRRWKAAAPGRVIPALAFHVHNAPIDSVRRLVEAGQIAVLGEVLNQFVGVAPNDSLFEPYLALAEARDVPIGIHIGPGPAGAFYLGATGYRAALASPVLLEEVLIEHPTLRVYVMHAGWPMLDEMLLMLHAHPQLYVDVGVISYILPIAEFHSYVRRLVDAGFGKRILFGSDQMVWPQAIEIAIGNIEAATFLSAEQKRDIFYHNAARFLRLTPDEIARHHRPATTGRRQPRVAVPPTGR
jgi:predicted TIM-barrel fold metal-dependent hydrolase